MSKGSQKLAAWRRQCCYCSPITFEFLTAFLASGSGYVTKHPASQEQQTLSQHHFALRKSRCAYLGLDCIRGQQDRSFRRTVDLLIQNLLLHLHTAIKDT